MVSHANGPVPWLIALFSGNRADASLLMSVARALAEDERFRPQWWVGGDHGAQATAEALQQAVPINLWSLPIPAQLYDLDGPRRMIASTRAHLDALQHHLDESLNNRPAAVVVLGDRFETLAVGLGCFYHQIPVVHLAGGDWTEGGCVDDRLRFMLSELASLHCCFSQTSADRLRARGYDNVHVTGSTVVDNLRAVTLTSREDLFKGLGLDPVRPLWLATQHPIPTEGERSLTGLNALIAGLDEVGVQVVWTAPNRDGLGSAMARTLQHAVAERPHWRVVDTLGRTGYLSWLAECNGVIGNTSSGLLETPYFGKPSITVGPRQAGRERSGNVVAVEYDVTEIARAFRFVSEDVGFRAGLSALDLPFGKDPAAPQVVALLAELLERST